MTGNSGDNASPDNSVPTTEQLSLAPAPGLPPAPSLALNPDPDPNFNLNPTPDPDPNPNPNLALAPAFTYAPLPSPFPALPIPIVPKSQALAFSCLQRLNIGLDENIPGLGFLGSEGETIPKGYPTPLPSDLSLDCMFFINRLIHVPQPISDPLFDQLQEFVTNKFTLWFEFIAVYASYEGLSQLLTWMKVRMICIAPFATYD